MNRLLMAKTFSFGVVCFRGTSLRGAILAMGLLYPALCALGRKIFSHHLDPELIRDC